jgi:hypothetical protein
MSGSSILVTLNALRARRRTADSADAGGASTVHERTMQEGLA